MTIDAALAADRARGEPSSDSEPVAHGRLIVAWQHPDSRLISPVGVLDSDGITYRFRYLRRALRVADFQPFVSFPSLSQVYEAPQLFPLFTQRIMSSRRPDYLEYLKQLHLDGGAPSPWEVLARSEGRRTGDTVQVFPVPSVDDSGRTRCTFLVHGIRWVLGDDAIDVRPGEDLVLQDEPDNDMSSDAVQVQTEAGIPVGYVPHLLLEHLAIARDFGPITLRAVHVNGAEAPPHLRLLVRLEGTVPRDYRPMSGPGWETFSPAP